MVKTFYTLLGTLMLQVLIIIPALSQVRDVAASPGRITIIIQPVFNGQPLKLNNQNYVDEHGDTLYIDVFKFYLTHVSLDLSSIGGIKHTDSLEIRKAFLFDAENSTGNSFSADNFNPGTVSHISFTLGVDSIDNTSGANDGDLDPINAMYWAWNSGYIMAKLEGHSPVCHTLHHAFEFHIGGYMPPYNTARTVHLDLPQPITVKSGGNVLIKINADLAAWFSGNLDLSKLNSVVVPGKEAILVADNYAQMFSVSTK